MRSSFNFREITGPGVQDSHPKTPPHSTADKTPSLVPLQGSEWGLSPGVRVKGKPGEDTERHGGRWVSHKSHPLHWRFSSIHRHPGYPVPQGPFLVVTGPLRDLGLRDLPDLRTPSVPFPSKGAVPQGTTGTGDGVSFGPLDSTPYIYTPLRPHGPSVYPCPDPPSPTRQ